MAADDRGGVGRAGGKRSTLIVNEGAEEVGRAAYRTVLEIHINEALGPQRDQVVANGGGLHADSPHQLRDCCRAVLRQALQDAIACLVHNGWSLAARGAICKIIIMLIGQACARTLYSVGIDFDH